MIYTSTDTANWTAVGAQDAAQRTYASVQQALASHPKLGGTSTEIFLQGSYANSTNVRGDSDVDIVVMLPETFIADTTRLNAFEKIAYDKSWVPASYGAAELRRDLVTALKNYYGNDRVEEKDKCIRITKKDGYVDADVVPAIEHRLYKKYTGSSDDYIQGTALHPKSGGKIVNYPKEHRKNGTAKNLLTASNFKPTVRQLKNLKRNAVALGVLDANDAPGYLLECMVYNTPNDAFVTDAHGRLAVVMNWLLNSNLSNFMSADGIHTLFGTDPGDFSDLKAKNILTTLANQVKWA